MLDGRKLKSLRQAKGWSQNDLGSRMSKVVPMTTISAWEVRDPAINNVELATVLRLCDALGCSFYDLMSDDVVAAHHAAIQKFAAEHRSAPVRAQPRPEPYPLTPGPV